MRKNFGAKPILYPQPVFIIATYGKDGTPNAMNAAWGGLTEESEITVCISAGHKTTANIIARGAFTISMADADHIAECDYVGIVSANDVPDKFERAGFHATKSKYVNAPIIDELPMTLECRLVQCNGDGIYVGAIFNVSAEESILDENGKIDVKKLDPIIYDGVNHAYWNFGEQVGRAFSDGKKLK